MSEHTETELQAANEPPVTASRRRAVLKGDMLTIHFGDDVLGSYDLSTLPNEACKWAAAKGVASFLLAADDVHAAFERLVTGNLPTAKGPAQARISPWSQSIVNALVATGKKATPPVSADKAREIVAGLTKEQVRAYRADPAVIKEHDKLVPRQVPSLSALIAA